MPQPQPSPIPDPPASGAEAGLPEREAGDDRWKAAGNEAMLYCPLCSARLESRKCKLLCSRCGYYMSCADYY